MNNNSRYSVISLFKEYGEIKIPIIQRDYAQGRRSAKKIRKNFLNSIKYNLNKGLHLDFIYGSVKEHNERKVLILLDGQQRITTLFLLYLYIALKEEEIEEFQKFFCFKKENLIKSKLRYEVRASSEEFLDYIVSDKNIKFRDGIKPSEIIKDKNWFYLGWNHDPTISGMLNMLDDIDETFMDESELFNLLYNDDSPKITFDFLELNNFGLTDDLYIKMNSRGKLLTPYENFKAKFEKHIECYLKNKNKFYEIARKFEKDYMDIFWKYAKRKKNQKQDIARLTDKYMHWFFYNLALNLYAINNESDLRNNYSKIDDFIQENSLVSFFTKAYKSEEINNLIEFLDYMCSNNQDIPEQVRDILIENPTLWDRVKFYAYYLGIIEHKEDKPWYRVLKNLINNTLIQSLEDYINALKAIKKLSDALKAIKKLSDDLNGHKILNYIINTQKNKFIDFFSQNQQTEEILKAKLINNDSSWEIEIIEAENHWYLDGKIGFLIEFSKNKDTYDLKKFKNYRNKFIKLWDFARENMDNQLLYQALLSKGDYLPQVGQNKTFCSFEAGIRAKFENWHKVFESDKKEYLKSLLDDIELTDGIENQLNSIINNTINNKVVTDWRKCFIENLDYIKYCEKLQLRFYYNDNGKISKIYLLKRKQMNGYHVELHSWHLFNKCFGLKPESDRKERWRLEGEKLCEPFNYTEYVESTSYEEPYILLESDDLKLSIIYKNGEFQIERINEHENIKESTFSMPKEDENCCELLIKQITNN